jgi:hypothetical protein
VQSFILTAPLETDVHVSESWACAWVLKVSRIQFISLYIYRVGRYNLISPGEGACPLIHCE